MKKQNELTKRVVRYGKSDFDKNYLNILDSLLENSGVFLVKGTTEIDNDDLLVTYDLPENYYALSLLSKLNRIERLKVMGNILEMAETFPQNIVPIWDYDNIGVNFNQEVIMIKRGYTDLLSPFKFDKEDNLQSLKTLLVNAYNGKKKLAVATANQAKIGKNDFEKNIAQAASISELQSLVLAEVTKSVQISQKNNVLVNRGKYRFLAIGLSVASLALVGLGYTSYKALNNTIPKKDHIIQGQSDFIINNYDATISELKKYEPADLPVSAQYILAKSYIQVENLNAQQREEILKNLSLKTPENIFKYWIYNGRGQFQKSLDIAKNIGDKQLTIYAYSKLYESTKVDTNMSGEKKEKLLQDYKKQIEDLTKDIKGEATNE